MSTRPKLLLSILMLCSLVLLSGCAALLAPRVATQIDALRAGQYRLDQDHAALLFKIEHFQLSMYVGRFNSFDASLDFDPGNIKATRLEAVIEMDSLDINNTELKDKLLGVKWFDQENHPQAGLTTSAVRQLENGQIELLAKLAWRGVSKPVVLVIDFNGGARNPLTRKYTVGFSAVGSFLRSDFGMTTLLPIVGDEVKIEVYAEFQKD